MFLLIFLKMSWYFMWIVCKLHEMSRHFIWKINEKIKKKKKKMPLPGFELGIHRTLNERFTHYTTDDVTKVVKITIVIGWIFQCTADYNNFAVKKILIFVYHFVICTSHFLSNARFYRLQTALKRKKKKKKKKKKNARNAWMKFLPPLKPRILDIGIFIREKKYRKLQCRINERKTPIFNCKTTVVNNAELSSLSGYWSGVPCKTANFACNVYSEAGSLAVEKQWLHLLSGWNVVLIAYLWLFFLFFLDEIHFIWLSFFQKAEKLSSANNTMKSLIEISSIIFYFIWTWSHTFDTLIFLPNILHSFMKRCTKNHGVEYGASYFFSCLLHQKNVKNVAFGALGGPIW